MKYHIVISTTSKNDKRSILQLLETNAEYLDEAFETKVHEVEDDPSEETGEHILWYHSESHGKNRYYVGPPVAVGEKPQWSYKKQEAQKLSLEACKLVAARLQMMGYKTPVETDKGSPALSVVQGNFGESGEEQQGPLAKTIDPLPEPEEDELDLAGTLETVLTGMAESMKEAPDLDKNVLEDMVEKGPFAKSQDENTYVTEEDDPTQQIDENLVEVTPPDGTTEIHDGGDAQQ